MGVRVGVRVRVSVQLGLGLGIGIRDGVKVKVGVGVRVGVRARVRVALLPASESGGRAERDPAVRAVAGRAAAGGRCALGLGGPLATPLVSPLTPGAAPRSSSTKRTCSGGRSRAVGVGW